MHHDDTREMIGTLMTVSPTGLFSMAPMLLQLVIIVILAAGAVAVVAAIARRMSNGPRSALLALAGRIGLYAGIGGAAYVGTETWMTASQIHETRFVVMEPEVILAVATLLLGVIVWLIARFGNAGGKRA